MPWISSTLSVHHVVYRVPFDQTIPASGRARFAGKTTSSASNQYCSIAAA